jgi:rod shape determining protein RodA
LPAQHTDFVFSVIGEEAGFIGSVFVILLFLFIILRGIYVASVVRNRYASLMVIGAVTVLGFHIVVNIGMTVGMMPVTGIPLPFLSYGGSFLISCMILIGLIINASIRRFKY